MPTNPLPRAATFAATIHLYRCAPQTHGRGGHRILIGVTRRATIDTKLLAGTLSPGRYRLEGRSTEGKVVRVRMLTVPSKVLSTVGAEKR